jgi:hypothetical protein
MREPAMSPAEFHSFCEAMKARNARRISAELAAGTGRGLVASNDNRAPRERERTINFWWEDLD